MDCKTARLLLECANGRLGELDAAESASLEQHLAGCLDCDSQARAERGADRAIAKAMRAVEVPTGLRNRLRLRMERERADLHMRRLGRMVRWASAAALLFALVGGIVAWRIGQKTRVDMDSVWAEVHQRYVSPPGRAELEDWYHGHGYHGNLPRDLNYSLLTSHGLGAFEGRVVPQMVFRSQRLGQEGIPAGRAEVRILSYDQFDLRNVPTEYESPDGYDFKVTLWKDDRSKCAELIVYSGTSADWLRRDTSQDDGDN